MRPGKLPSRLRSDSIPYHPIPLVAIVGLVRWYAGRAGFCEARLNRERASTSDLIKHLRSFNRKERFILLREALGTDVLGGAFRRQLGDSIRVAVPANAFVAMDYHLDWLQMALYLADNPLPPQRIRNDDLVAGTQEDADLLVAFQSHSGTQVVLIEAKVEMAWTNSQLTSKARRLRRIFGDGRPGVHLATPHYVLASPKPPPPGIGTAEWPDWMKPSGKPVWMELRPPSGLKKPTRCTAHGKASQRGRFVRIDSKDSAGVPVGPGLGPDKKVHNGRTYTVDGDGFVILVSGQRDKRYKYPLGQGP